MPLNVRVDESRSFTKTLVLDGRLNNETVAMLDRVLDSVLDSPLKVLVLDLAGLEYISSTGLRPLFRAQKSMKPRAGEFLVLNPQAAVKKVFDIVQAVDVNEVFRSVSELDACLDRMQRKASSGE